MNARRSTVTKTGTEFDELVADDPAMRLYATVFATRVRDLRGFALGLYAEARVAAILDAELSTGGTDDADILWRPKPRSQPITIQVRACRLQQTTRALRGSLRLGGPGRARLGTVWVFATHQGDDHRTGWHYHVRSANELDALSPASTIAARKLAPLDEWIIGDDELRDAVSKCGR